ncbi:hypothetical protein SELMODRAFT_419062 [Selaginella moellendorffii]|uniref:Uncharacterized protein n=1 Tax=Selaginella moellendorffii TaxID=88036 RepID=D8S7Q1_SELML|nr:uncharacterized protein LOC9660691 isoform X1 [Selaginella moellendorffii]EFJ19791.1 hypothetical protein SELMODRAFT_419062 [Selaginella moellendorffii]|eukprot:XP_002979383.1 uncharacterized protein LOC9660691 isoform X1 [Selaginella moellendorffii]
MARRVFLASVGTAGAAAAALLFFGDRFQPAVAESGGAAAATKIGQFKASGLLFNDIVEVIALPDPKIEGITIHISNVKRSLTERLSRDFFTDPSQASVSASQTGPLRLVSPIALGLKGEEVFSAKRNLFFKTMHVRRIYDEANNALVYVAYSTRVSQDMSEPNSRYRTSVSSISLYGQNFNAKQLEENVE